MTTQKYPKLTFAERRRHLALGWWVTWPLLATGALVFTAAFALGLIDGATPFNGLPAGALFFAAGALSRTMFARLKGK